MKGYKLLPTLNEAGEDYEELEKEIFETFKERLFMPLLTAIGVPTTRLTNERDALKDAIQKGRITFNQGVFAGRFSAATSKRLKSLGAKWDKKTATFRIHKSALPKDIQQTIAASLNAFQKTVERINKAFAKILPAEIAENVKAANIFDSSLWKFDRKIGITLESVTVLPKLTAKRRKEIAKHWGQNLELSIKNFADEEILKLRTEIMSHVMKGGRYESVMKSIEKAYGVTQSKAKFLARQETNLLLAKFKESRYVEAGVNEYIWRTVVGSKNHPVRPSHKILDGTKQRFDNPPITTGPNEAPRRNNPGEDYNCRCFAVPIVKI